MPRVALIIVSYNHARFLRACFGSLDRITYPRDAVKIFFVDNQSADESVAIASAWRDATTLAVDVYASPTNTGFAGGNNGVMRRALDDGFEFVYLLNPDTEVEPNFLEQAVAAASRDNKIGAAQSLLVLDPGRNRLNSTGNAIHFLGFGFSERYRDRWDRRETDALDGHEIGYASGAGVLYRADVLRRVGLLDETLFAYHEDMDLSWRIWLAGFRVVLASKSVVYHTYEFSRSIKKYYLMERNRYLVHFKNLKWGTLTLIAPAMFIMEFGLLLFSFKSGWWREKFRVIRELASPGMWKKVRSGREETKKIRAVPDRVVARLFMSSIGYQEIDNPLLRYVGNPLMRLYWMIVRPLIRW